MARKRKPLVPVETSNRSRSVRFKSNTHGLRIDPKKNSDDDFSMESWQRRSLASSKTPKINNLTNSLSTKDQKTSDGHVETVRETMITSKRTMPAEEKTKRKHGRTTIEKETKGGRNSRESTQKSTNSTTRNHSVVHQQQPKQPDLQHRYRQHQENDEGLIHPQKDLSTDEDKPKEVFHHQDKLSMKYSPAHSRPKKGMSTLSPRKRMGSGTVFPTRNPTMEESETFVQRRASSNVETTIDTLMKTTSTANRKSTGDKPTGTKKESASAHHNANDIDDMDCASSGDSCLQSTSSSSESPKDGKNGARADSPTAMTSVKRDNSNSKSKQSEHKDERNDLTFGYHQNRHHNKNDLDPTSTFPVPPAKTPKSLTSNNRPRINNPEGPPFAAAADNNEFFHLMMTSATPATARRDAELLGSTVGADGRFMLHDDDSDITSVSRASKTPRRRLFPPSGVPRTQKRKAEESLDDEVTPPVIDNLPPVGHNGGNGFLAESINGIDEDSIEAWSIDGDTALPFQFEIDGKYYAHPALPPGWKMKLSRTRKLPVYTHPDHGRTWHCPVVLPHKSMNKVYARSSIRTLGNQNASESFTPNDPTTSASTSPHAHAQSLAKAKRQQGRHGRQPLLTPPSPPSSAVSKGYNSRPIRTSSTATKDFDQTSIGRKAKKASSVLENLPCPQNQASNDANRTVKFTRKKSPLSVLERLPKAADPHSSQSKLSSSAGVGSDLRASHQSPTLKSHVVRSTRTKDPSFRHDTPGTMSDLLRSYERDKNGDTSVCNALSAEACDQSGYDCDISRDKESSSSTSTLDSRDQSSTNYKSTPRSKGILLSSKRYQPRGGQQKLSPIREATEPQLDDALECTEAQSEVGDKGKIESPIRKRESNLFETPCDPVFEKNDESSRTGTSLKSPIRPENSTDPTTNSFRTPKSSHSYETKEGLAEQIVGAEEVAVLRHGSSRRKKRPTPLLTSACDQSGFIETSTSVHTCGVSSEKKNDATSYSSSINNDDEWSPLANLGKNLQVTNSNAHVDELASSARDVDEKERNSNDNSVAIYTPGLQSTQSKSPTLSGIASRSDDNSFHSPYRSDIKTPKDPGAIYSVRRSEEKSLTNNKAGSSEIMPEVATEIHQSVDDVEAKDRNQKAAYDNLEDEEDGIMHAASPNKESAIGSESPIVFETNGDDYSAESSESTKDNGPKSSEKNSPWSNGFIHGKKSGEDASLLSPPRADSKDTRDQHNSSIESDDFSDDASGPSFETEPAQTRDLNTSVVDEQSSQHRRMSFRKFGWRVLHPPHPICSLQRLDEIISLSRSKRLTSKRSKQKKKPKKTYGTKPHGTQRRKNRKRN